MRTMILNHRNGETVVPKEIQSRLSIIFKESNCEIKQYATTSINNDISLKLKQIGWSDPVRLSKSSKITITAVKNDIGLCMQTGNVGRMYADLLKLQALYIKGIIRAGIIIVPTSRAARILGGNLVSLERLERELHIFNEVITMPILMIGFCE